MPKRQRSRRLLGPACFVAKAGGVVVIAFWLFSSSGLAQTAAIDLLYHERAPYYIVSPTGEVGGLVGEPVVKAFKRAGLAYRWVAMAANAQFRVIRF
jgi:hypothetical protein